MFLSLFLYIFYEKSSRISRLFFNKHINGTKESEITFHIAIASPKTSEIKISNQVLP